MSDKVVSFERDAEFHNKRGKRLMKAGRHLEAVGSFRAALERDTQNAAYLIDLADALSVINRFKESNDIVYDLLAQGENRSELFYILALNLMSTGEYEMAKVFCERYLDADMMGEYADDVTEMIDAIEQYDRQNSQLETTEKIELRERITEASNMLFRGSYKDAIKEYKQILEQDPANGYVLNNLALAYFCKGEVNLAVENAEKALGLNKYDVHALCNILLFLKEQKDTTALTQYKKSLLSMKLEFPEEIQKVVFTMAEISDHEMAYKYAAQLLYHRAFDAKALHAYAAACYHLRMYDKAEDAWVKIVSADPDDLVALYHVALVRDVMNGRRPFKKIVYAYQLPMDEVLATLKELNDCLMLSEDDLQEKWDNSRRLYIIVRWGLTVPDMVIKSAVLNFLRLIGGRRAEMLLKSVLTDAEQPDETKRAVLAILKELKVKEPYVVHLDGMVVEAMIGEGERLMNAPNSYKEALQLVLSYMVGRYFGHEQQVFQIWEKIVDIAPALRGRSPSALAALIEYAYLTENEKDPQANVLAEIYDTNVKTLKRYIEVYESWRQEH